MIDRFEKFIFSVFELYRCLHKIAGDVMKPYHLKGPHAFYIAMLYRSEGTTASRLSELCGRDKADISRAITTLEQYGIVSKTNTYRATIHLTDAGKALAAELDRKIMAAVSYAGKDMTDEDRSIFYAGLDSLVHNLQELSQRGMEE